MGSKTKTTFRPGDRVTIRPGVLHTDDWDPQAENYRMLPEAVEAVVEQMGGMPVCEWDCWVEFSSPEVRATLGRSGNWVNFEDLEVAS